MEDDENEGPTAAEAAKKWSQFMEAHDQLRAMNKELAVEVKALRKEVKIVQENVMDLVQLGETIVHGINELIAEGISLESVKGVLGSAIKNFFNPYRKAHGG